jgi:alanine-synthesizing transaminase
VIEEFHRVKRLPPYVFAEVNRLKAAARARGADIIDLGMGNPDMPTPQHIVDKLVETVAKPRTNRYSASRGIPGLRKAQAAYYARRFGVKLNPETQVVATLGSKEGFANMAQAITAPGDVILVPSPTYPITSPASSFPVPPSATSPSWAPWRAAGPCSLRARTRRPPSCAASRGR